MKNIYIDFGCGNPTQKYKDCYGVDINFNYKPDIVANLEKNLPFRSNSVDFINSDNSLEHTKNPYSVLKEFHRILKPKGQIRIVIPNGQYFLLLPLHFLFDIMKFWNWYMNLPWKKERTIHYVYFTKYLIELLVQESRFKIVKTKGFIFSKNIEILAQKVDHVY